MSDEQHYECAGIGVGPANLSLASLLHGSPGLPNIFLEKREVFSWHDGQQIPDATLQVSVFKDLVSLSDPTSSFSFLSYLKEKGRIYHFINAQFGAVPRQEFRNYLEWASRRNPNVVFGEEVESVDFDGVFVLRTNRRTVTANNVSIGIGSRAWVPAVARDHLGPTQFHVSEFMPRSRDLVGKRVCVVGGGQSGAEAFLDLISRPPAERPRRISWVSRRHNFSPIDDSPFTNDFYMPGYSDYFARLDQGTRESLNREHVLTSDGISESTLREIYQRIYAERFIHGNTDLVSLYPNRNVTAVSGSGSTWSLKLHNSNHPTVLGQVDADVVVWATGFRSTAPDFLAPLADRLEREGDEYRIDSDYAVRWDGPANRSIFLQNAALGQRGLADKNLSLLAWRSQRIIDRVRCVRSDDPVPSFIEWSAKLSPDERVG
ncbi:lysine N(6)-hydroxylase/L-ornithine N(5)-oxygenase family protein [Streptomyces sp. NBC_00083]|uniref:lysine N(6)-hydroxylase/L-ornithine N(5)-oxygenase family protein n=1 Tax=Streptomyces sp. NBC_00083 TaxID=2975647 RepID=UPI00225B3378|nr:SidA/IucD/PvdA family monooxygenase [Streptomyces sp. NBC_00083]MCX5386205.1 SidA/IucD/PvdA family monooxygenase [Streptomyces sp. NBC_00083]